MLRLPLLPSCALLSPRPAGALVALAIALAWPAPSANLSLLHLRCADRHLAPPCLRFVLPPWFLDPSDPVRFSRCCADFSVFFAV